MKMLERAVPAALALLLSVPCAPGLPNLIELDVAIDEGEGNATFVWERDDANGPAMEISRRLEGEEGPGSWVYQTSVPHEVTSWTDPELATGLLYEYRFFIPANEEFPDETAAYVCCGIEVPLVDQRGTVLLVVDDTLADPLSVEIDRFIFDLAGDGWTVDRLDFARNGNASPESLRSAIQARHAVHPLSSVILLGNLPVVFSGLIRPDEHEYYRQATDLFYADVDGVWQDVLSTNVPGQQNFYPGDGHYDEATVPGPNHRIEIPIGRIDLSGMTAWQESEVDLLRRYLDKDHNFRHRRYEVPRQAYFTTLAYDVSPLEAAAVVAMLGPESCVESYVPSLEQERPFLWGFAGRDWNGSNYPGYRFKSQFTLNFASGKQAWNWENNQMRAMLAMPWYGLTCCWGVRPNWLFHPAGMGATLGYCNYRTVNNNNNANPASGLDYAPGDDFDDWLDGHVHINLMGDPTLRIHPVKPVKNLSATLENGGVRLSWTNSGEAEVVGSLVYSSPHPAGPFSRLTTNPIGGTTYFHGVNPQATTYYMVRSVKLERTPVGSYYNAGQGVSARVASSQVNHAPVPGAVVKTLAPGASATVTPLATDSDGDFLSFFVAGNASHGEITGNGPDFVYTPEPGFTGNDSFQVNVWDGVNEVVATINLVVEEGNEVLPSGDYATWQAAINWQGRDSSPGGDADGDGLDNLWEFHLSRNPLAADDGVFEHREVVSEGSGEYFVLEFRRRKNNEKLGLQWSTNGVEYWVNLEPDGNEVILEMIDANPLGNGIAEDVRLKVRLTPQATKRFFRMVLWP